MHTVIHIPGQHGNKTQHVNKIPCSEDVFLIRVSLLSFTDFFSFITNLLSSMHAVFGYPFDFHLQSHFGSLILEHRDDNSVAGGGL